MRTQDRLAEQLRVLGVPPGAILLVHASFKSLGVDHPETVIQALLDALSPTGTLLLPALTYLQEPHHLHDARRTPSCVGYLTEYFRTRPGTRRSLHPTHSVCGVGAEAEALLGDHFEDDTPCGPHSPFRKVIERGGKILMIGCGLRPNTTMHAIEEYVHPPYLFAPPREYEITDLQGQTHRKTYHRHGFYRGYDQRYDRVGALLGEPEMRIGTVGDAACHLLDAGALRRVALEKMQADPFYFVDVRPRHE